MASTIEKINKTWKFPLNSIIFFFMIYFYFYFFLMRPSQAILVCLCILFFSDVFAKKMKIGVPQVDDCSSYDRCRSCIDDMACGWCDSGSVCIIYLLFTFTYLIFLIFFSFF